MTGTDKEQAVSSKHQTATTLMTDMELKPVHTNQTGISRKCDF